MYYGNNFFYSVVIYINKCESLSVCLFVCLSVCLFVCLSVCYCAIEMDMEALIKKPRPVLESAYQDLTKEVQQRVKSLNGVQLGLNIERYFHNPLHFMQHNFEQFEN